jgi:hypothetical protein
MKDFLFCLFLVCLMGFSLWKGMEFLAFASMGIIALIVFKERLFTR